MDHETVFTLEATPVKYGPGAVTDAGWEARRLGITRALLVTDPGVAALGIAGRVRESVEAEGIEVVVYDRARVEPTLESLQDAAAFALDARADGFISVGGGSAMDTAKVADLVTSHPAEVMAYVNPPVGEGASRRRRCRPHLAIPTRSARARSHRPVAVLDIPDSSSRRDLAPLPAPSQAIVDPS
jgi:alcohol dehydrogenase class IV